MADALKPICIGQSHMVAVVAAAKQTGFPLHSIALKDNRRDYKLVGTQPDFVAQNGFVDDSTLARLHGPVFSFIGGMAHIRLGLRKHPRPFDFVLPEASTLPFDAEAELIPYSAMSAVLGSAIGKHLQLLTRFAARLEGPIFQFEAPPPPADSWLLAKSVAKRRDVGELAGPWLRYKLWRLNSEIVREHAEGCGVRFVPVPEAALDGEGFLRAEFCKNASHANPQYGELLLEQISARMATEPVT